jgi:hypothetical protein
VNTSFLSFSAPLKHKFFENNFIISPSILSNNLLVTLATLKGKPPTPGDRLDFRIGNTKRSITRPLFIVVTAGTSIFNAGSTELKTKPIQFFVYVGWRASNGTPFILISRISHGRTYADFSATTTNEYYGAYSDNAPASTDQVELIGRFTAQNSGTASFNWSIATQIVINKPDDVTDWLTWQPVYGAMYTSVTTRVANYKIWPNRLELEFYFDGTTGGAPIQISATLPFESLDIANNPAIAFVLLYDAVVLFGGAYVSAGTPDFMYMQKYNASAFANGAGRLLSGHGMYRI